MKTIGSRRQPEMAAGARFSESIAHLAKSTFIPKGIDRFKSHEAANKHQQDCLARGMGLLAAARSRDRTDSRPATLEDLKTLLRSLNANGQTYDTPRRYSETLDLDGIPVRTVSLEGLLLTKQTMRDKDVSDRLVIERALAVLRQQASGTDSAQTDS